MFTVYAGTCGGIFAYIEACLRRAFDLIVRHPEAATAGAAQPARADRDVGTSLFPPDFALLNPNYPC